MKEKPKAKRGCIGRIVKLFLWAVGLLFALVVAVAIFVKPPDRSTTQLTSQSLQPQTQPATPTTLQPTETPPATNTADPPTASAQLPTDTPLPTATKSPTQAPVPLTATQQPTETPPATNTADPPTASAQLPTDTPVPAQPIAVTQGSNPDAFTCIGGCAEAPNPTCNIKGNVNSKKEKIYHMEGWRDYNRTDIKPEEGDRWFCIEQEAIDAGFRAPKNH